MRKLLERLPFSPWWWHALMRKYEEEFPGRCGYCSYCRFTHQAAPPHVCKEEKGGFRA